MKRYLSLITLAAAAIGVTAGMALANERREYPDDFNGPPIYTASIAQSV